jgi:hypothetical protein
MAAEELGKFRDHVRWALEEFGQKSASDLELITTIIYADREAARQHQRFAFQELVRKVREVKPRFTEDYIAQHSKELAKKGLLVTLATHPTGEAPGEPPPGRRLGTLKGTVGDMAPDFDAPLEDFREFMG